MVISRWRVECEEPNESVSNDLVLKKVLASTFTLGDCFFYIKLLQKYGHRRFMIYPSQADVKSNERYL
jgi:hypothetical protein